MRELPRQLSVDELAELFEGRTRVRRACSRRPRTRSGRRDEIAAEPPGRGQARGARRRTRAIGRSSRARAEQHGDDPAVLAELARAEPRLRGEVRLPLRRLREPAPEGASSCRCCASASTRTREEELDTGARRAGRDRARTAGSDVLASTPTVTDWLEPRLPLAARDRRHRLDRHVVLLRRARQPSRPPRTRATREASPASRGRSTAAASTDVQKYRVAPHELPEPLHWFKWEAYTTWLSGFALLVVLYYFDADTYLIDPSVADISPARRSRSALGLLAAAWVVYDVALPCSARATRASALIARGLIVARGVGRRPALRAARGVPPGRRDARDDHGRERLLRDHPGALGADPREGGGTRARSRRERSRQAALGAQQLPDAAGGASR